jgi:hypothetical protein
MTSQRDQLMEKAWPTLSKWINERVDAAREGSGLTKVMIDRDATTLATGLLRNQISHTDADLTRSLGSTDSSTYPTTPPFSRLRCTCPIAVSEPEIDVLQQIGWESDRQHDRINKWVDKVIAVENGFAWHGLGVHPGPLNGDSTVTVDDRLEEVITSQGRRIWIETVLVAEPEVPVRSLNAATLQECKKRLDSSGSEKLWILVSGAAPHLDDAATDVVGDGAVSLVSSSIVPARYVVVAALGALGAVLLRGTPLTPTWDYAEHGVELVLEQVLAVEVLRPPRAVYFALPA